MDPPRQPPGDTTGPGGSSSSETASCSRRFGAPTSPIYTPPPESRWSDNWNRTLIEEMLEDETVFHALIPSTGSGASPNGSQGGANGAEDYGDVRSVNRYSSTFTRGGGSSSTTAGSGGGVSEAAGVGDAGGVGNAGVGVSNRVVEGAAVEGFRYGYGGAGRAVTRGGAVDRSPGGRVGSDAPSGRLLGAGGAHARSGCSRGGFGSGLPPFCLSDEDPGGSSSSETASCSSTWSYGAPTCPIWTPSPESRWSESWDRSFIEERLEEQSLYHFLVPSTGIGASPKDSWGGTNGAEGDGDVRYHGSSSFTSGGGSSSTTAGSNGGAGGSAVRGSSSWIISDDDDDDDDDGGGGGGGGDDGDGDVQGSRGMSSQGHDTYDSLELVSYFTSQAELSPPIHSVAITPTAPTAPTAPTPTASTAAAATAATAATSTRAAPLPPPQSWVSSTNGQSQNRSSSSRRRRPARSSTSIHARINSGAIPSSSSSCLWKHIPMSRAAAAVGGRRGEGRRGRAREPSYPHSSSPMDSSSSSSSRSNRARAVGSHIRAGDVDVAEESLDSVAVKIEYGVVPNDRVTGKRRREDDVDLAEKCFNDVAVKIEQGAVPNDRVTGKRRREDDVDEDDTSETDGGGGEDVGDQDSHDCNQNGAGDDHDDGSLTSPSPSKRSRSS